jgi:mRNA interferase RelE/StbE
VSFKILLSKKVVKFLDRKPVDFVSNLDETLLCLSENPYQNSLDVKKLKGLDSDYRLRFGKYRFLFTIFKEDGIILIYKADTRGDIYK